MDYKLPERYENSNKASYGKVVNVAGSDYMPGAAYLSSISALKTGCGYCFLVTSERVIDAVAAQSSNIVFVPYSNLVEHIKSADVVEIGCGLSQSDSAIKIFNTVIDNVSTDIPLIIDADAINILAKNSCGYKNKNFNKVVLTPHPKEASRLLDCSLQDVLTNIEQAAFEISKMYNCITVLKTNKTVVVSNTGEKYLNTTGNNAMAKAGSGDVLTGMISGLAAQGMANLFETASLGVYLHGLCGDIAKKELTEYSVMAEDLISCIPLAVKTILN